MEYFTRGAHIISLVQALKSEQAWTEYMEALTEKATSFCAIHAIRPNAHLTKTGKALNNQLQSRQALYPPHGKRIPGTKTIKSPICSDPLDPKSTRN